jgi:hypothetical protein
MVETVGSDEKIGMRPCCLKKVKIRISGLLS